VRELVDDRDAGLRFKMLLRLISSTTDAAG